MKKILLLIILFKSLTFGVDEKYEQLAQQSNTCAAYFVIASGCFESQNKDLSNTLLEKFDFMQISSIVYYKKSIPTRSGEMLKKLSIENILYEEKMMLNTIEENCGNISLLTIKHLEECKKHYDYSLYKVEEILKNVSKK